MASLKVNKNNVDRWGIFSIAKTLDKDNFKISDVVENLKLKMLHRIMQLLEDIF